MHKHRIWVAIAMTWLFLLFNIERIYEPINIASFVYVLTTVFGVALLLSKRLRDLPLAWTIAAGEVILLTTKCLLGYYVDLESMPLTFLEGGMLAVTMALTARIGRDTDLFSESTRQLVLMNLQREIPNRENTEIDMQQEFRRARRHERPVAMLRLRLSVDQIRSSLHRFAKQLEDELVERYATGCVAQLLSTETKSDDIVSYADGQFLLMLPETSREQAVHLAARLKTRIEDVLELDVDANIADFPTDELTLSGVIERVSAPNSLGEQAPAVAATT